MPRSHSENDDVITCNLSTSSTMPCIMGMEPPSFAHSLRDQRDPRSRRPIMLKLLSACVLLMFVLACTDARVPTAPSPPTPVVAVPPPIVVAPSPHPLLSDPRFSLGFYRQFVKRPLARWTQPPWIYLRTIDEGGRAVDPRLLDLTAAAIINTTSAWTGGAFGVAGLERGTETRIGQAGWITVAWANLPNFCGTVTITVVNNGQVTINQIVLNHVEPICTCGPITAKHELGHALGYNHTDSPLDLMSGAPLDGRTCDKDLSARERFHAQLAYSLPAGSLEP